MRLRLSFIFACVLSLCACDKSDLGNDDDPEVEFPSNGDQTPSDSKYSVRTIQVDKPSIGRMTLSGQVSGLVSPYKVDVGFEISVDPEFSRIRMLKTQTSTSIFSIEVSNILDQFTYYYRAYAVIDGKKIYGKTESFTTPKLTYQIDGKTYEMVIVEGGPYGDFSIMPTEYPTEGTFIFNGIDISCIYAQSTGKFTKGLMRELLSKFPIHVRYPSVKEWQYAAKGGNKSKGFAYAGSDNINDVAWHSGNASAAHSGGEKLPNELGLYDMCGNKSELCLNDLDMYIIEDNTDVVDFWNNSWASAIAYGGNWTKSASECTIDSHFYVYPGEHNYFDPSTITIRLVVLRDPYHDCTLY